MTTTPSDSQRKISIGATAAFAILLAILLGIYVWQDYRRTIESANTRLLGEAYALGEQAESLIRAGSIALASTRQLLAERGGFEQLGEKGTYDLFMRQIDVFSKDIGGIPMHALFYVDASGHAVAATTGFPTKRVDASEREYFRHFSTTPDPGILISPVSISKLSGLAVIFLNVGIRDDKGRFVGVLGLSLRLKHFDNYYRQRGFRPEQTISLVRTDGKPIYRNQMNEDFATSDLSGRPGFQAMLADRRGNREVVSPYDGQERLAGYMVSDRYPLLAVVTEANSAVLEPWWRNTMVAISIYTASLLALSFLLRFALRQIVVASDAASASEAKSRFLATMSHEIRTPLNGILGMAQLLQMPGLSETERQEFASTIVSSGRSLLTLLNDVLDLSKVEAGKITLEPAPTDPASVLRETAGLFAELARGKQLALTTDIQAPAGRRYLLDAVRVRQMLSNLLSNAIKFTDRGAISLSVREIECSPMGTCLEFSVTDTGRGIAADRLRDLFQPFSQLDNSSTRAHDGTGLGLSIVRSLAGLMGGTADVDSTPGQGSRFWFRIRADLLPAATESSSAFAPASGNTPTTASNTVLIADDDPTNRKIIETLLQRLGIAFVSVQNGQQAFDVLAEGSAVTLVLMDIKMPVMGGHTAAELIRDLEMASGRKRTPIIGISAHAFDEDRKRAAAAGMDDFLTKPFNVDDFTACIDKWLDHPNRAQ